MARLVILVAAVVLVGLWLTGHPGGGPLGPPSAASVAELLDDPGRWVGNSVRVTGQVGHRVAVLGYGGFTLRDRAGSQILVLGAATPASIGQTTTVTGKFVTAFAVMDLTMPVILAGAE